MPFDLFPLQKIFEVAEADWESIKQKLEEEGSYNKIYDPNIDGYLDASKITSGVFSVDRIPELPRSKITDFFDSPFWDNIPDKPSSYPPSAHASSHASGGSDPIDPADIGAIDSGEKGAANGVCELDGSALVPISRIPDLSRSKITDFWNSPFWDNIPDKPDVHKVKTSNSDDSPNYLSAKLDADVFEEDDLNYIMKLKDGITQHISFASGFGVKFNASASDPDDKDKLIKGDSHTGAGIYYYDGSSWLKGDFNCNKLNAQSGIVSGGNLNLSEQEAINFVIENQETLPSTTKIGRMVFNTSDNHLYVYVP